MLQPRYHTPTSSHNFESNILFWTFAFLNSTSWSSIKLPLWLLSSARFRPWHLLNGALNPSTKSSLTVSLSLMGRRRLHVTLQMGFTVEVHSKESSITWLTFKIWASQLYVLPLSPKLGYCWWDPDLDITRRHEPRWKQRRWRSVSWILGSRYQYHQ